MTIEFIDLDGNYIKQWPNWNPSLIPQNGDWVILHYGDKNETKVAYKVNNRVIDGTNPDKVVVVVDVMYDFCV